MASDLADLVRQFQTGIGHNVLLPDFIGISLKQEVENFPLLAAILHMNEGKTHNYYWIESNAFDLHDLVTNCPEVLIGKTVAITAFDSGPLSPNDDEEKQSGCGSL